MAERVAKGTWVELGRVVLAAGERAPQVPEETQAVIAEHSNPKGVMVSLGMLRLIERNFQTDNLRPIGIPVLSAEQALKVQKTVVAYRSRRGWGSGRG